jgi:Capsule polysaccharide biosynthesis protein
MKAYVFFSVHELLFDAMAKQLAGRGVDEFTGFVWGTHQQRFLERSSVGYGDLVVFTRDLLAKYDGPPDLDWLARRERELGISVQRMLESERHLLAGRTHEQIMKLAEVGLREIAAALDRTQPDFIFSEDVSCFHSYAHFVLARERGIKFWAITSGRLPERISVYSEAPQMSELLRNKFHELRATGLSPNERELAESYVAKFRDRPARPTGMATRAKRPKIELADARRLAGAAAHYFGDRGDPTAVSPWQAVSQRLVRMSRVAAADLQDVFEKPVAGERYVLYPIHFQPEASTLVQAPMYLDQVQLLQDVAASLPIGVRLYVKEHVSNRGRRPLEFYQALRAIPSVRLLGPDEDTWALIRGASAIAVITGTMGWEGLMFERPVVTFGEVFFNHHPSVLRADKVPKDGWFELFTRATNGHVIDREATLAMVAALHYASRPGFMGNPKSFPEALAADNVEKLANALAELAIR